MIMDGQMTQHHSGWQPYLVPQFLWAVGVSVAVGDVDHDHKPVISHAP
jgi:hypothetical protein